jgi:hypothetical protein
MSAQAEQLAAALRAAIELRPGESLYGVVDAAQDEGQLAFEAQRRFGVQIRMLFHGEAAQYMGHVAPWLVPIDPDGGYLECWAERWGKNPGILLTSAAPPEKLFRHLREIFVVKDEGGQEYFFRYYDPRVLRVYLPTCTPSDSLGFFGSVCSILFEAESREHAIRFSKTPDALRQEIIRVGSLKLAR